MVDKWTHRVNFSDEEIIEAIRQTPVEERHGNLWTFFDNLPRPEKERLVGLAHGTLTK